MGQLRLNDIIIDHSKRKGYHVGILTFLGTVIIVCVILLIAMKTV